MATVLSSYKNYFMNNNNNYCKWYEFLCETIKTFNSKLRYDLFI